MPDSHCSPLDRAAGALLLIIGAWWGLRLPLPAPQPEAAAANVFSAERALKHVRAIATRPHQAGTEAAAWARDYIRAELTRLGIPNEVQRAPGLYQRGSWIMAGNAENLIGTIRGTAPGGPALLLSCHYDSVALGPAAADDGAGVGVALETARALKAGAAPRNDVVLLFDVEETGMTGADAYARSQLARNGDIVDINVEARGTSGPAFLFQTSANNAPLIDAYAAAASVPAANSLTYEIYRRMPNDTDVSVFRRYGYAAYDFAFIDNVLAYHTAQDDIAHLSPASVQHEGEAVLALARRLAGDAALGRLRLGSGDATYFNAGGFFFHYPAVLDSWATVLLVLLTVRAVMERRACREASWRARLAALATPIVYVVTTALAARGLWALLCRIHPDYASLPQHDVYARDWYIAAMFALSAALGAGLAGLAMRWASTGLIMLGGLMLSAVLALLAPLAGLGGATYIVLWPVLGGVLALPAARRSAALAALLAWPALWLMLPVARYGFMGLSMTGAGICCALFALMMLCLAPALIAIARAHLPRLAPAALAICVLALAGGGFANRLDAAHPLENNINYLFDADTRHALWVSQSTRLDPWLKQLLGAQPERVASLYDTHFPALTHPAPALALEAPAARLTRDYSGRGLRMVEVTLTSHRNAIEFLVQMQGDTQGGSVEGLAWQRGAGATDRAGWSGATMIYYSCPGPDGAHLGFTVPAGRRVRFRVFEPVPGLPRDLDRFRWMERGPGLLASPARPFSDQTIVVKSFEF